MTKLYIALTRLVWLPFDGGSCLPGKPQGMAGTVGVSAELVRELRLKSQEA